MLIYLIVLVIVVSAVYAARRSKSAVISWFLIGIALATMVLTGGLRDRTVGTDTGYYVMDFDHVRTFASVIANGREKGEYGFWILVWLVHLFSDQYVYFLLAVTLVFVICHLWAMDLYSKQIEISFFFFITAGIYVTCFNAERQAVACAIYALAVGPLIKGNFKKYLGWVLVASLFHQTALVAIPAYFVMRRPVTARNYAIIALIGIVTVVFFHGIMSVATGFGKSYSDYTSHTETEGAGYTTIAVDVLTAAFFVFFRKSIHIYRDEYDLFLNMFLFAFMIEIVTVFLGTDPSGLRRLTYYFALSPLFVWPIIFKNLNDRLSKFVVGYSFVVCYMTYFVLTTQKFSNLVPYMFNSSVFTR